MVGFKKLPHEIFLGDSRYLSLQIYKKTLLG
jgi:hypothetical protein